MNALMKYVCLNMWALDFRVGDQMMDVLESRLNGSRVDPGDVEAIIADRDRRRAPVMDDRSRLVPTSSASGLLEEDERGLWTYGDQIAVIPIDGMITKYSSMVNGMSQPEGTVIADVIKALAVAREDPSIAAIVADIDSPGGTVAGGEDIVEAIRLTSERKPVIAFCHDQVCSGAYLIASQCDRIVASANAEIGSIGVFCVIDDRSKQFEASGVRRHVVRSASRKGTTVPGIEISEDVLESKQREIGELAEWFITRVAEGRGMSEGDVRKSATGEVWVAGVAMERGLIDAVAGYQETLEALLAEFGVPSF